jgi:glycosyltransferase involved in cell wall biosynthesis
MRICRVATVPFFVLHHLRPQLAGLVEAGHRVLVVCSPEPGDEAIRSLPGIDYEPLAIARPISPLRDVRALWQLTRLLRRARPDVLHSTTPKAGLLVALAGRLARVPVRLHTFTGQPWAEQAGPVRWIAQAADWLVVRLNTRCYADSRSQRDDLVARRLASCDRLHVLGPGSLSGVDLSVFDRERLAPAAISTRRELGIADGARVIVFVGRLTRDKGVAELVEAFASVRDRCPDTVLLLVGPDDARAPLPAAVRERIAADPRILTPGYTAEPQRFIAAADLLCLPSYREGFGSVVIEAAALGIPAVGTRIVGLSDAIVDGVTGVLVPPRDMTALAQSLADLLEDGERRLRMGEAARERARAEFDARRISRLLLDEYEALHARYSGGG